MKRARRSAVWDHFSKINDNKVQCQYCDAIFAYHSATTPLLYHLRNVHPNINTDNTSTSGGLQQQTIPATLARKKCDGKRANEISKLIVNMIVKDMLPLSVTEGEGFRELIEYLEPEYHIPCRKTLTKRLEQQYEEKKAELKEKLATVNVALTTDCWTALTTESYITVTCHYIEANWQVKSAVLLTENFSEKHTADNLAEKLKGSVDDWGLAGRVVACVHDNARNIVAANDPTRVSWKSLPCFEQLQLPKHRLIQSCKTRWNSVCDMFERLMEQRWAVTAVLSDRTVTKIQDARALEMKDEHWQLMEDA